eukprot:TRINITY_DN8950_c0_g1_i1.p3 TRINITY_DN8950_c0_g1~~TRINITY_DN8950_c0_g1_i1.p3  ORF type:complete len:104 (-),score=13.85 TRINITY_DN8950_c0_g1_i1:69-380(-)
MAYLDAYRNMVDIIVFCIKFNQFKILLNQKECQSNGVTQKYTPQNDANRQTQKDSTQHRITTSHCLHQANKSVSYTHLTLPTICSVQISVVAVSFKKKKNSDP